MNHPVDAPVEAPAGTQPESAPGADLAGKLTGSTRRSFIRDVAVAGTSTAAALYGLDASGAVDLVGQAEAAAPDAPLSEFSAIAPSVEDTIRVPEGFSWQVVIGYGDQFANTDGTVYRYGYNNDYLAYFPLRGSEEGLLFVNHEYVDAFFTHGYKTSDVANGKHTKSRNEVRLEQEAVGNSIVHVRRREDGAWQVVSPSPYNRRIFGGDVKGERLTPLTFTGPLSLGGSRPDPKIGERAQGSIANCSGGTTPWGTALSCEENYDGYGESFFRARQDFAVGWDFVGAPVGDDVQQTGETPIARPEYLATTGAPNESRRYGWVCEHDPYTRENGRKHTALGRFRHENTAFRVARGKKFVLYMGDDQVNQGVYKFVSTRAFDSSGTAAARENNLAILTEGQLYVARFTPEGRRRFARSGDLEPITPESGTGTWVPVDASDLFDTRLRLAGVGTSEVVAPDPGDPNQNTLPLARRPRQRTAAGNTDPGDEARFAGRYNRLVNAAGDVYLGADPAPAGYYNEWDRHFASNRPEDVEVAPDGSVYVALTNNSSRDSTTRTARCGGSSSRATTPRRPRSPGTSSPRAARARAPSPARRASPARTTSSSTPTTTSGWSRTSPRRRSGAGPSASRATTPCSCSPAGSRAWHTGSRRCPTTRRAPGRTSRRTSRRCS
jgi:secreted PhoX family phosphatase